MKQNVNIAALGYEIDHGKVKMNPMFYSPPYNMTPLKPKATDIKKIKEQREDAKGKANNGKR